MSEPKRTGLLEMLGTSQGCQFVIPVYQRNYTWSAEREVKQYIADLKNVLEGRYNNHFLGIIIYLEKSIDFSTREFSIIDGQQRLTTTFLMIYAIKKMLVDANETDKVNQLEGQYLTNPYHSDKVKYKLKPLVSDDNVYRCIVENRFDDIDNPKSNVLRNYNYIMDKLNDLLVLGYSLNDILMALNKLYVVCVPISEEDNAQKIFESINATGVKLTSADLIRNFMLMDLHSDTQEDYYAKYWKKLEENISQDSKELEMFFRMFLAIKTYNLVAKNSVYRNFVDWVEEKEYEIKPLFEELLKYAKAYNKLLKKDISNFDGNLKTALRDFRNVNSDIPLSITLEFMRMVDDNVLSVDVVADMIQAINAYMIRRSICDINSQNVSKLFPSVLKRVIDKCDGNYDNILKILNQEMVGNNAGTSGSYMPTDRQMHEFLFNANVYKRPALRIVLDRLELENNPAPVDLSKLSVEHLMPQTATEEWLEELDTDIETYMDNLHRLGNLTLATKPDNSKMKNLTWEYKNKILEKTAHLTLNVPLLQISRWDLKQIDIRTKELIDRICELYPYPEVSIVKSDGEVDEKTALQTCRKLAIPDDAETVRKNNTYKTKNPSEGFVIVTSKMYPQGDKEKYWFGYREKRFDNVTECEKQYLIMGCRLSKTLVVKFPKEFIEAKLDALNNSVDENGEIKHWHIVLFKNPDGKVTMLLSKPTIEEIDVTDYVVGEE